MRNIISAAILAPAILLAGCSDSSSFFPPAANNKSAAGKVYDGYLAFAKVCVDVNLNRDCDAGEPNTLTDANGDFNLTGLTDRQAATPLVIEVVPGTIDLDTGLTPPGDLKFIAPAGSSVISAFSTLIQLKIEAALAGGSTQTLAQLKTAATAQLAAEMGVVGLDLGNYDPIAAKNNPALNSTDRERAAKLHIANRVLSEQISTSLPAARANAVPANDAAAFNALLGNLDAGDVMTAVNTDLGTMALVDLIALPDLTSVTSETPPVVPNTADIQVYANQQAAVNAALNALLPPPPLTGGTGGAG